MNAMYFNVPQSRQRVIIIGFRNDLDIEPSHPKPQTKPVTVYGAIGHLPAGQPGKHQDQVIEAWRASMPGQSLRKARADVGSFHSVRLDPRAPSPTQISSQVHWRWDVPRQLTIREAAILQGFPEDYRWAGTKSEAQKRIGNSVPPNLMRAIAEHIKEALGYKDIAT